MFLRSWLIGQPISAEVYLQGSVKFHKQNHCMEISRQSYSHLWWLLNRGQRLIWISQQHLTFDVLWLTFLRLPNMLPNLKKWTIYTPNSIQKQFNFCGWKVKRCFCGSIGTYPSWERPGVHHLQSHTNNPKKTTNQKQGQWLLRRKTF